MAEILADIELTSAHTLTGSFADITGMSTTVTIAGTGSVVLLLMSITGDLSDSTDETGEYRFTVDASAVGAETTAFKDTTDGGSSCTLAFAVDGLSTGSHTFAVQGANVEGTVPIDTTRIRLFQVIEITTGAEIVVDISSTSVENSVVAWTVIDDMTATITAVSGRAYLMFATNPILLDSAGDTGAVHSFGVGGTREGPVLQNQRDNVDEGDGVTLTWVATGISGSTVFDLQWQNFAGFTDADTTRPRILQVIELESTIFNLLTDITSVTADTVDSVVGVFTVVDDMEDTVTIAGTGSVVIKLFNMQFLRTSGGDKTLEYRLRTDSSLVGAEIVGDGDAIDRQPGQVLIHAEDGLSGSTDFDAQWTMLAIDGGDPATTNTNFNRTFQVLELLPEAAAPPPFLPVRIRQNALNPILVR